MDFLPETFTNTLAALPEMDLAAFLRVHAAKGHTHTGTQKRTGEGVTMDGRSVGCFPDGTPGRGVNISGKDSSCCVVITAALIFAESRVKAGQLAQKELIPDHQLAMSTLVSSATPSVSLTREQALRYLRKEDPQVTVNTRGWTLMRYEDMHLGWAKILPNRINNYYPKELRILKDV